MKATRALLLLLVGLLLADAPALAQETTQIPLSSDSKVWIDGTSNKTPHWTVHATELEGHVTINPAAEVQQSNLAGMTMKVPAKMLKSKKSSIMDRLMYDALKVKQHTHVIYELTSIESVNTTGENTFTMETLGNLTLAGQTKQIAMTVEGTMRADGMVVYTGSHTMLMSDYKVKPPTAMFGALHTGDEVVVHAELVAGPFTRVTGSR